ncbi:MAG: DUF5916 domain-containing protein [Bacteroidota bacterium]
MQATRALSPPHIDGIIDDACWVNAQPTSSFTQHIPVYNVNPTQQSEVRIVYDDNAIYVAALLFDTSPDSILKELGGRDDELNGDFFELSFDTYNMQSDAYTFGVYASGVQFDSREEDDTYDGVWKSAVKITDKGWMIELMIPFSAIRFPAVKEQVWGLEIIRSIRRHREHDYWALPVKGASNEMVYWGKLKGITGITAPLRLSVTPYISVYGDHFPYNIPDKSNYSYSFSGGLDLKYGLNESYTLDMTLLPDFSQVQSDYDVKNISAFETVYDENRPFFNEAVDLFEKGDLFYSRRIGKEPQGYNDIYDSLSEGSNVIKNPSQAKLINATKLSGRSRKGTAIGFLNALTRNTYAEIEDSAGNSYALLTEPLTNYNILVFDQVFKNNSDVYITNSSVIRDKKYNDANVTAAGITLHNRSITWQFGASGALSQILENAGTKSFNDRTGYQYSLNFGKVKGNFHFMLTRSTINDTYNDNDLGLTLMNNQTTNNLALSYSIYEPFWKCRDFNVSMNIKHIENFRTKYLEDIEISISNYETLLNYLSVWDGIGVRPLDVNDFYEARVPGRVYLAPAYYYGTLGFSSDYRKTFALDFEGTYIGGINDALKIIEASLVPIVRASDKFMFKYHINGSFTMNDKGFAAIDSLNTINFGRRNITTLENLLEARYIFMNDLWIGINARHYWSMAQYDKFYELLPDGHLDNNTTYSGSHDFNFNAFNLDLQFSWQFAPGSNLSFVYKNIINNDETKARPAYFRNIGHTFESDQLNSISLKVLYYLDYSYLVKRKIK